MGASPEHQSSPNPRGAAAGARRLRRSLPAWRSRLPAGRCRRRRPSPGTAPARPGHQRRANSLRFAVIGDSGSGARAQYEVGEQLSRSLSVFPYEFVLMLGDNIYGSERPQDFVAEVRASLQGDPRPEDSVLRRPGQPRRSEPALLRAVQHEREAVLHVREARRPVLRAGQQLHGQGPAGVARARTRRRRSPGGRSRSSTIRSIPPAPRHGSEVDLRDDRRTAVHQARRRRGASPGTSTSTNGCSPRRACTTSRPAAPASCAPGTSGQGPLTAKGFDSDFSYMLFEIDGDDLHFQALTRRGKLDRLGNHSSIAGDDLAGGRRARTMRTPVDRTGRRPPPRWRIVTLSPVLWALSQEPAGRASAPSRRRWPSCGCSRGTSPSATCSSAPAGRRTCRRRTTCSR